MVLCISISTIANCDDNDDDILVSYKKEPQRA